MHTECAIYQHTHSTVRWSGQRHGSGSRQTESLEFCAQAFVDEELVDGFLGRRGRMFCLVIGVSDTHALRTDNRDRSAVI